MGLFEQAVLGEVPPVPPDLQASGPTLLAQDTTLGAQQTEPVLHVQKP